MDLPGSFLFWVVGVVLGGAFLQRQIRFIRLQPLDQIVSERYRVADACVIGGTVLLLFGSALAAGTQPEGELTAEGVFQAAIFYVVLVTGLVAFLKLRGLSPVELFGLRRPFLGRGLLLGLGGLVLCYPLIFFAQFVSYEIAGKPEPQLIVQFLVGSEGWVDRASVIFVAVLVAPLAEEFLFRGYFYGVLRKWTGRWWGLAISTLVFAGVHGHLPSFAGLFILGLLLGLLYERSGSLWVPVTVHAVFNGASVGVAVFLPELIQ